MVAPNDSDPESAKLNDAVADLNERYYEMQNLLTTSTEEVSRLVSLAIKSGEVDVDKYKTAKESCDLYKDIQDGLKAQWEAAQLELWNYGLHKAQKDWELASARVRECRMEILNMTTDKSNLIRSANADKSINPGGWRFVVQDTICC